MNLSKYFSLFLIVIIIFSCSDNNDNDGNNSDNYNRQALLSNIANNIILPAHTSFNDGLDNFSSNVFISVVNFSNENRINFGKSKN